MRLIKLLLSFLALTLFKIIVSQESYSIPPKIPAEYITNTKTEFDNFVLKNRRNADIDLFNDFAEMAIYRKRSMLLNGNIYYNFRNYESYLNNILKRLLEESDIENKDRFHAYLKYDDSYNAFAMPDGTLLVTMGMMADCKSEDALACILAHEIAHVKFNDSYKEYKKNTKIDWRNIDYKEIHKIILSLQYSRSAEMRADSLGFLLALKAGFDIKKAFTNYDYLYRMETRNKLYDPLISKSETDKTVRYRPLSELAKEAMSNPEEEAAEDDDDENKKDNSRKHLASHPETMDRVLLLYRIIEDEYVENFNAEKSKQQSSGTFMELQKIAKGERLRVMLHEHKYKEGMETAFLYHLADTANQEFLYYELESMRRFLVVDNTEYKNGFLNFDLKKVLKKRKSILHLPLYLIPDSTILPGLQGIHYFDSAYEFESYKQAFLYFLRKADTRSNSEVNLTAGLFYKTFGIQKGDSLLLYYISDNNALYKEYASSFLHDQLYSDLEKNTRDIVLCSDVNVYTGNKTQFMREYISSDSVTGAFSRDFNSFHNNKLKNTEVYFLKDQPTSDFPFLYTNASIIESLYYIIQNPQKNSKQVDDDEEEEDSTGTKEKNANTKSDDEKTYSSYMYSLEPETWAFLKNNSIRSVGGFYSYTLYDKEKIARDLVGNATGILIPGALAIRAIAGSHVHKNRFVYFSFHTAIAKNTIRLQYEESKERFRQMDYVNTLYYKIIMNKKI